MVTIRKKFNSFTFTSPTERASLKIHPDYCVVIVKDDQLVLKPKDSGHIKMEGSETEEEEIAIVMSPNKPGEAFHTSMVLRGGIYEVVLTNSDQVRIRRGMGRFFLIDCTCKVQLLDTYLPVPELTVLFAAAILLTMEAFRDLA